MPRFRDVPPSTLAVVAILLLAACNSSSPTLSPVGDTSPGAVASSGVPATPALSNASPAGPAGQTDTDWGRIWDELPEAFPVYPGATPAEEAATEAVSGIFALQDADPRTVAAWMQTELERGAYRTEALNGPFEDGSFVLDLVGATECRIQVAVAPLGGLTLVTVRYGAACPGP
jgi:hypothetical protein